MCKFDKRLIVWIASSNKHTQVHVFFARDLFETKFHLYIQYMNRHVYKPRSLFH